MSDESDGTAALQRRIDRLRAGDPSARDELISASGDRLTRLARKMLKGYPGVHRWEQTDDVLQNATLRLCRALNETVPPTPADYFRLAALQIRRELIDLARHYQGPLGSGAHHASAGVLTPREGDDRGNPSPGFEPADVTNDPSKLLAWAEFHRQAEALPEDDRATFDLIWYQGLSQAEVAEILGVSERTVKRRWQSARTALYRALDGELPDS